MIKREARTIELVSPFADDVAEAVLRYLILMTDVSEWDEKFHDELRGAVRACVIEAMKRHGKTP